jgi:hypothetical protein
VPTSVLLAVLAAAGLLALAPALVRRYDATERLVAERALSTARVLSRADRRRRTVPGRRPVNPPRLLVPRVSSASGPLPAPRRNLTPVPPAAQRARRRVHRAPRAMYRRRRVLLALVLLNLVEVCGITLVSPGFWVSFAVTGVLLVYYLAHLRTRALRDRRRRRDEARYAAWIARREALAHQLAERDRARREAARLNALRGRPYDTRASGQ